MFWKKKYLREFKSLHYLISNHFIFLDLRTEMAEFALLYPVKPPTSVVPCRWQLFPTSRSKRPEPDLAQYVPNEPDNDKGLLQGSYVRILSDWFPGNIKWTLFTKKNPLYLSTDFICELKSIDSVVIFLMIEITVIIGNDIFSN